MVSKMKFLNIGNSPVNPVKTTRPKLTYEKNNEMPTQFKTKEGIDAYFQQVHVDYQSLFLNFEKELSNQECIDKE
jgi:hypothetical protein